LNEEATSRTDTARTARALLAPALADLEARELKPPFATRALEHAAHAMSALYGAQTEAQTEAAAKSDLRKALEELSHALAALHEAPGPSGEFDAVTSAVAHALAFLYPIVSASQRKRRDVLMPGAVGALDREQRSAERVRVEVDIGLLSDSNFYTGLSEDISSGGVFVATDRPLPRGTIVTLYFTLPDGRPVRADGSVRWARGGEDGRSAGMGVGFSALGTDDRRAIADYCTTRPPLFHE
jgi:uncharacterized protein (TIGR02266 family)